MDLVLLTEPTPESDSLFTWAIVRHVAHRLHRKRLSVLELTPPREEVVNNRKGFTLVELMIVVAIIGILAAIAVPNFVSMQYRSKRAEIPSNVDGIKTAQIAYDAAFDTYIDVATLYPDPTPDKSQRAWPSGSNFDTLGWSPDGKVRGSYKVLAATSTDFEVTGICDVDGDGTNATYTATKSLNSTYKHTNDNIY